MNQPPLNPDALEAAARALLAVQQPEVSADYAWNVQFDDGREELRKEAAAAVSVYLAAALPEVTSVEELDQLPIGSAVLSEKYIAQQESEEYPCVFQKLYTGDWHRGGRSSDTHPDYFLPARVLHIPEVNDA